MVRSSGEQPRDVKRRYAIRGGSIPPRAEQQEKSIFCSTFPPLETVQPTRKEDTGQANSHWHPGKTGKDQPARKARVKQVILFLAARKDEQNHFF